MGTGSACSPDNTWTATPGNNENLPLNCVNWFEAYAFCIWDGGFLPTALEWEYAAAGGDQQREYPWGATDPGTNNQFAIFGGDGGTCYYPSLGKCDYNTVANIAPVGFASAGAGRWGHLDLAGNLSEWALDEGVPNDTSPSLACTDCEYVGYDGASDYSADHANLGGYFYGPAWQLVSAGNFVGGAPTNRDDSLGFRCARTP
jgi:formylglycine-generating enzyme required for sulfatase activity